MADEHGIDAVRRDQVLFERIAAQHNIKRQQRKVDLAKAELRDAQLQEENRIMKEN